MKDLKAEEITLWKHPILTIYYSFIISLIYFKKCLLFIWRHIFKIGVPVALILFLHFYKGPHTTVKENSPFCFICISILMKLKFSLCSVHGISY